MTSYQVKTKRQEMVSITRQVNEAVQNGGLVNGICVVYCPHTTAGVTINENADPDVQADLLLALDAAFPDRPQFRHMEGNSAAHAKASCVGASVTVPVREGRLALGRWQGIYFCEFDGPRDRQYFIQLISG